MTSPDGAIQIDFSASEWRMSIWSYAPRVTEIATGRILLDLWTDDWDASVTWIGDHEVQLDLRRYSVEGRCLVLLDPKSGTYRIELDGVPLPIADVRQGVEKAFASSVRPAEKSGWWYRRPAQRFGPLSSLSEVRERMIWIVLIPLGVFVMGYSILAYTVPGYEIDAKPAVYETIGAFGVSLIGLIVGACAFTIGLYSLRTAYWAWRDRTASRE